MLTRLSYKLSFLNYYFGVRAASVSRDGVQGYIMAFSLFIDRVACIISLSLQFLNTT